MAELKEVRVPLVPEWQSSAVARPGDLLIIGLAIPSTPAGIQHIADKLREQVPDGIQICVIDNVSGFQVVRGER
jgi:hypothetical protein